MGEPEPILKPTNGEAVPKATKRGPRNQLWTSETGRLAGERGRAVQRAIRRIVPLPQPTGEVSEIDKALLDNVRTQLARVHQKIMNSTCGAQAMARYAAAETKLIELHNSIMDRVNSQKPPAPPSSVPTSSWQSGAVSKSVAAAK